MEPNQKPPKVKIFSGTPEEVEHKLNDYGDSYSPIQWNYSNVGERLVMTVVCVHDSVIRRMQIASPMVPGMPGRGN